MEARRLLISQCPPPAPPPLPRSPRARKPDCYLESPVQNEAPLRKRKRTQKQAAGSKSVRKNEGKARKVKKVKGGKGKEEKMTLAMRRGMGEKLIYVPETEEWQYDEEYIGEAVRGSV